jgi:hypothetical protein
VVGTGGDDRIADERRVCRKRKEERKIEGNYIVYLLGDA